jgi:hypothetical protein
VTKGGFVSFYARRAERFYGLLKKKSAQRSAGRMRENSFFERYQAAQARRII